MLNFILYFGFIWFVNIIIEHILCLPAIKKRLNALQLRLLHSTLWVSVIALIFAYSHTEYLWVLTIILLLDAVSYAYTKDKRKV